jgi:glycosyl transferase family 87
VTKRLLAGACVVVGLLYFAKALYRGASFNQGDFYFSLPGAYAQRLNPALWNSADLKGAIDFNHGTYMYGPSQYLTLYPIVFLDSYRAIAAVLLGAYAVVALLAWLALRRLLEFDGARRPLLAAGLFGIVFAFLPLAQVLIQREFEAVAWLALVIACGLYMRGRDAAAGAAIAYLAWFKYWPVVLLGGFVVHRRFKGLAGFAAASAVLLLSAQVVFGLQNFLIGKTLAIVAGLVRPLGSGYVLYPVIPRGAAKSDFCRQWIWGRGTAADVRWALCGVEDRFSWIPAKAAFFTIVGATAIVFVWAALRFDAGARDRIAANWHALWEFSVLTIAGATFVHAHYYYFIVLLLPLCALAWRYAGYPHPWRRTKIAIWTASYLLLNALMLPTSWMSAALGQDAWGLFLDSGLPLLGLLLLLGLVLWEFVESSEAAPLPAAVV